MKKQVVFIHGGEAKENFENYIDFLNKIEYDPYYISEKRWKHSLSEKLGESFEVFMPNMPNKGFANYYEWRIMFEKVFPFLNDEVILIGHSLGGSFLVKYLNENNLSIKINKILLVSGAFQDNDLEVLGSYNFDKKLSNFKKYQDKIIFYHSKDDNVVSYNDLLEFKKILPESKYTVFEDRGHFLNDDFPEIINDIKN